MSAGQLVSALVNLALHVVCLAADVDLHYDVSIAFLSIEAAYFAACAGQTSTYTDTARLAIFTALMVPALGAVFASSQKATPLFFHQASNWAVPIVLFAVNAQCDWSRQTVLQLVILFAALCIAPYKPASIFFALFVSWLAFAFAATSANGLVRSIVLASFGTANAVHLIAIAVDVTPYLRYVGYAAALAILITAFVISQEVVVLIVPTAMLLAYIVYDTLTKSATYTTAPADAPSAPPERLLVPPAPPQQAQLRWPRLQTLETAIYLPT